jgi:hypothetical protein
VTCSLLLPELSLFLRKKEISISHLTAERTASLSIDLVANQGAAPCILRDYREFHTAAKRGGRSTIASKSWAPDL